MPTAELTLPLERLEVARQRRRRPRRWRLPDARPLWAALVLYPLWWALGLGAFSCIILAIPMARTLFARRPLRLPPAFGIWLLFLFWNVISLVMLPVHAPHTNEGSLTGRSISLVLHFVQLASATVFLLYLVNLSEKELPQHRALRWMSVLFLITVAGGFLALASPHFQ